MNAMRNPKSTTAATSTEEFGRNVTLNELRHEVRRPGRAFIYSNAFDSYIEAVKTDILNVIAIVAKDAPADLRCYIFRDESSLYIDTPI
jgi:hypothetical protein